MNKSPLCEYLEWDTKFFGVRIGRVVPRSLNATELERVLLWVDHEKIDCLYFLCEAVDAQSSALVQQAGFLLTDMRLTFETSVKSTAELQTVDVEVIRPAIVTDIDALKAIARTSYGNTRFYADPNFPRDRCAALYETWIEKSCIGFADAVLVAVASTGRVAGYVSCHKRKNARGEIGLIAVAPQARGQGWSDRLVRGALGWFAAAGSETITVVTQGGNVGGQRLYQRSGFLTREAQLWFHFWPARGKAGRLT